MQPGHGPATKRSLMPSPPDNSNIPMGVECEQHRDGTGNGLADPTIGTVTTG